MKDKLISVIAFFMIFWILLKVFTYFWGLYMPWTPVSDLWALVLLFIFLVPLASILARLLVNAMRQ
ncbi:hypothetical protein [Oceanobacillus manasiensis]|uniref:hypothetical protein n=1 Tax=Oceanobacillus manasiensis TaxID=586413 RepID=UPI0005AA0D3F|nr:hypothetical protein [Oceanobacillus manasiensis]